MLLSCAARATEHKPQPVYQLSLSGLGYPGVAQAFLDAGSSVLAVHFLDDTHLLLSFGLRTLVPRLPHDPDGDDDHMAAAEVVELPSGKVLARTEWHLHDHSRYLWSLGQGRMLVRIADQLFAMNPLANLDTGHPFELSPFPNRGVRQLAIFVSPDDELLTLESVMPVQTPQVTVGDVATVADQTTLIDFYRISGLGTVTSPLRVADAGRLRAPQPMVLPVDADGYLWAQPGRGNRWAMSFEEFGGKSVALGPLMSSCYPRLQMVSRSEFVALSCQGTADKVKMLSYGLDGHETWEEPLGDLGVPSLRYAPAAARFALGFVVAGVASAATPDAPPEPTSSQEVRVYQNASGDLLLKAMAAPAMRTQENFDLSPSGLQLVVAQGTQLQFYTLPAVSAADHQDMAEVAKFAPPNGSGPVQLLRLTESAGEGASARAAAKQATLAAPDAAAAAPAVAGGAAVPSAAAVAGGTDQPTAVEPPRTAPTLLKPGERAEFQDKRKKDQLPSPTPQQGNPQDGSAPQQNSGQTKPPPG